MTQLVYSDPTYIDSLACSSTVPLSTSALYLLNATIDELVQISVHALVRAFPLPVTVDSFKSTFQRVVGLRLGKECLLEAELAARDLLKRSGSRNSLRADPALAPSIGTPVDADERTREGISEQVFASLREWVMQISGLGVLCPPSGPANLTTHLSELVAHRTPPAPSSPHVSFFLALYVERTLTSLALHLLETISLVVSRTSTSLSPLRIATAQDLEVAFKEDEQIWTWVREMKVRTAIERESLEEVEMLKSPTFGGGPNRVGDQSAFAAAQQQLLVSQARKGSVSRNSAVGGGTGGTGSYGLGIRRGSVDSAKSSLVNGFGGGSTASSATSNGGGQHRRKPSLALSVVQSVTSSLSNDDPFDQLLNSGQTRKLSMTPDRLRMIEVERARKASELDLRQKASKARGGGVEAPHPPLPVPSSARTTESMSAIPETTRVPGRRRMQARGPHQKDLFNEEAEDEVQEVDSDVEPNGTPERNPPKTTQSLMDLLSSPPPWSGTTVGGVPMGVQDSRDTNSSSGMTRESDGQTSGGEEAWVNVTPQKRQKGLKAKDEKRDVASERQINNDLVSLFRDSPPGSVVGLPSTHASSTPYPTYPNTVPSSPPLYGKKSKGGLRGFLGKVTGNPRKNSSGDAPAPAPPNPFATLPQEEPSLPSPSTTGSRPRMRSISAQSNFSFGGTSQTTATTYALPPGLGETPEKEKRRAPRERQRSESESAELKANRGERLQLASSRPRSPPPMAPSLHQITQPPVSILKANSKRSSYSARSGGAPESLEIPLPPPIPSIPPTSTSSNSSSTTTTIVRPPQRSSSLKRNAGRTPTSRSREPSSTSSSAPGVRPGETASVAGPPPTSTVPTGLPIPRPDSRESSSDPSGSPSVQSTAPSSGTESGLQDHPDPGGEPDKRDTARPLAVASTTPSSPVKLRQLLLADSTSVSTLTSRRRSSTGVVPANGGGGDDDRSSSPCEPPFRAASSQATTTVPPRPASPFSRRSSPDNVGAAPKGGADPSSVAELLRALRTEMDERCADKAQCLDLIDAWIERKVSGVI
ncbi:hypothetical protein JCM11491_003052 [Sporobolomyces phaffii]